MAASSSEDLTHIPLVKQITTFLRRNDEEANSRILSKFGPIFMFTGARQQGRIDFPLHFYEKYFEADDAAMTENPTWFELIHFDVSRGLDTDYSGAVAFRMWEACKGYTTKVNIANTRIAQQLLTYAVGGFYVEDLGILSFIFGINSWIRRSEVVGVIKGLKNAEDALPQKSEVTLLVPRYWSKMVSSLRTNLIPIANVPLNGCS